MSPVLFAHAIMKGKPIEVFNHGDMKIEMKPMQSGDVKATCADTQALARAVGFAPSTPLEQGLAKFAAWFKSYYGYA